MAILKKIGNLFGNSDEKAVSQLQPIVEEINSWESHTETLSDSELKSKTDQFRGRLNDGEIIDDLLPEAFAVVREAA